MGPKMWEIDVDFGSWLYILGMAIGLLVIVTICYVLWQSVQTRRAARRRIGAARVRSGHVPLEIPSVRGTLSDAQATYPGWARHGGQDQVMVDEQPRIHIRYFDMYGKLAERTIQVEHLDLQRRTIMAHTDSLNEPSLFPLEKIQMARNVENGKPFDLGTWVDAVRVARRRRETYDNFEDPQFI